MKRKFISPAAAIVLTMLTIIALMGGCVKTSGKSGRGNIRRSFGSRLMGRENQFIVNEDLTPDSPDTSKANFQGHARLVATSEMAPEKHRPDQLTNGLVLQLVIHVKPFSSE